MLRKEIRTKVVREYEDDEWLSQAFCLTVSWGVLIYLFLVRVGVIA